MNPIILDKFRGCLLGQAVGDALGYPVRDMGRDEIVSKYGESGITDFELEGNKALISECTQLALFTANGLLTGKTKACRFGETSPTSEAVLNAYKDWVKTQEGDITNESHTTWLYNIENLHSNRVVSKDSIDAFKGEMGTVENPKSLGKDFGALVRIAPVGLYFNDELAQVQELDKIAADIAASSHGYDSAYISAAILANIIYKVTYTDASVKEAVEDALSNVEKVFGYKPHLDSVVEEIKQAIKLAQSDKSDNDAISEIGTGSSADEVLAAAIFFSIKYDEDFEKAITSCVNTDGNSVAIGAVTGNILGAYLGARAIPENYLDRLQVRHIIQIIAEDLHEDCPNTNYFDNFNWIWEEKYGEACYII